MSIKLFHFHNLYFFHVPVNNLAVDKSNNAKMAILFVAIVLSKCHRKMSAHNADQVWIAGHFYWKKYY